MFSERKVNRVDTFTFGDERLEVYDDFAYLGINFDYKGQFFKAILV